MSVGLLPEDETAWLLAIGRRLRAEYAALEEPIPERLAALVAQLEKQELRQSAEILGCLKGAPLPAGHRMQQRYRDGGPL